MNKNYASLLLFFSFLFSLSINAQDMISKEGIPDQLKSEKLIFLKHESIAVGTEEEDENSKKYVILRQENHNKVLKEFNAELEAAVSHYPFESILAFPSELKSMASENRYVLYSSVYEYEFLKSQPKEGELIVFSYFIKDNETGKMYPLFEMDEMKIYDAKMMMKRLKRKLKEKFPEAY
jgi:hypothetical protein